MLAQARAGRARPGAPQGAVSAAARLVRPQRRLRPERRAAPPAQDSHRQQRRHRRQLPARRQGRDEPRHPHRRRRVHRPQHASCRARTATSSSADGANIGFNCEVFSASRVTIGAGVLMAAYSYVIGGDHDFSDPSKSVLEQTRTSAGVTIGDGAWIGAGAKILDGVTIGDARRHRRRRGACADGRAVAVARCAGRRVRRSSRSRRRDASPDLADGRSRRRHLQSAASRAGISSSPAHSSPRPASRATTRTSRRHARFRVRAARLPRYRANWSRDVDRRRPGDLASGIRATPSAIRRTSAGSTTPCASTTTCGPSLRRRSRRKARVKESVRRSLIHRR